MAYQRFTKEDGKFELLAELKGQDIMGLALKAPLSVYEKIYTLPMLTIKEDKGTEFLALKVRISRKHFFLSSIQKNIRTLLYILIRDYFALKRAFIFLI